MRAFLTFLAATFLCGCASFPTLQPTARMDLSLDESSMRSEVLKYVKLGTPIEDAKKIMEQQGFSCSFERDHSNRDRVRHPFGLICSIMKPQSSWWESLFISHEIRVSILFEAGVVTEINVTQISTCV